eukprot:1589864-Rhodomonas_salina.1
MATSKNSYPGRNSYSCTCREESATLRLAPSGGQKGVFNAALSLPLHSGCWQSRSCGRGSVQSENHYGRCEIELDDQPEWV